MTAVRQEPFPAREPRSRSAGRLPLAILILCLLGVADAGYLTYVHYAGLKVLCLASGGCETVQASRWAKLDGIPVAVLGLAGYLAILATLPIHAICQWCVASAVLMTALTVLTGLRFLRS